MGLFGDGSRKAARRQARLDRIGARQAAKTDRRASKDSARVAKVSERADAREMAYASGIDPRAFASDIVGDVAKVAGTVLAGPGAALGAGGIKPASQQSAGGGMGLDMKSPIVLGVIALVAAKALKIF